MDGKRNGCFSGGGDRTVSMFLGVRRDNLGANPDAPMPEKGSEFAHHNAVISNLVFEEYHLEMRRWCMALNSGQSPPPRGCSHPAL